MQYVALKCGIIIRFDDNKVPFTFTDGYFVGDVGLHNPQIQRDNSHLSFRNVESFTFHIDEISAHWKE